MPNSRQARLSYGIQEGISLTVLNSSIDGVSLMRVCWLLVVLALLLTSCTVGKPAFGVAGIELVDGNSVAQAEVKKDMRFEVPVGTELRVKFTDKLDPQFVTSLSPIARLMDEYTLAITTSPQIDLVMVPMSLKSRKGVSLGAEYTIRLAYTTPSFSIVEMLLMDGVTSSSLDINREMQVAVTGGAELRVKFSDRVDLNKAAELAPEVKLIDEYTLSIPLQPGKLFVLGRGLQSVRGTRLEAYYRIGCHFAWDDVRVVGASITSRDTSSSTGLSVHFDPSLVHEFPSGGNATVSFTLSRRLTQEEISLLPSALHYDARGYSLMYGDLPSIKMAVPLASSHVSLPEWLKNREGHPVELSARHVPWPKDLISMYPQGHAELEYSYGGSCPLVPGEKVVFKFHWPFVQSDIEAAFQSGLSGVKHTLDWVSEDEVVLSVLEKRTFSVDLEKVVNSVDLYGCKVSLSGLWSGIYSFNMTDYDNVKVVDLTTGTESWYTISPSISGAIRVTPDNLLIGHRYYHMGGYEDGFWGGHEIVYDLQAGTVKSYGPLRYYRDLDDTKQKAREAIEPYLTVSQSAWEFVLSPSGTKAVGIVDTMGTNGSHAYILDVCTGTLKKHFIGPYTQMVQRHHPLLWSFDEKYLLFGTATDRVWGESFIYRLDIETGELVRLCTTEGLLSGVSSLSYHVVVGNSVIDFAGKRVGTYPGWIAAWVSPNQLIVNDHYIVNGQNPEKGSCYLYDISTQAKTLIAHGKAFHYDANSNTVFMLTRK